MQSAKRTWFLPPDFTFTPDGDFRLGTVIPHPKHPTQVLAHPDTESPPIPLPRQKILEEKNHIHTTEGSRSTEGNCQANVVTVASALGKIESSQRRLLHYENADHEIRLFATQPADETLASIMKLPKVSKHVNSGMFGKRPVYIISGLRVTPHTFHVSNEKTWSRGAQVSGSASTPAGFGAVSVEAGGGFSKAAEKTVTNSYATAPGIIFAYRLHVIRPLRGDDNELELFSSRTAFLTGDGTAEKQEEMELAEVTVKELEEDIEETAKLTTHDIGDDECCITFM